jgi:hypothetical protein
MLLEDYLRCSGGLAKQATSRKPVVCALCTHRPGGASKTFLYDRFRAVFPEGASCYHINAFLVLASDDFQKFTRKQELRNPLRKILFDPFGDA